MKKSFHSLAAKYFIAAQILPMLLGGCVSVPDPYSDTGPGPAIEPIEMGQTLEAEFEATDARTDRGFTFDVFSFKASAGDQVTVTVRSQEADTYLQVSHVERLTLRGLFARDQRVYHMDNNGLNSEVNLTLPADEDGIYFIHVSGYPANARYRYWGANARGPYSISLRPGLIPSEDIVLAHLRVTAPVPIYGNTGKFMSPFTEDGTVAPWVEKGSAAAVGANVGSAVGHFAASNSKDFGAVGVLVGALGAAAGRSAAIAASGGWDYIKENTDLSFDSLDDMAAYVMVNNSQHPQYRDVLKMASAVYPGLSGTVDKLSRLGNQPCVSDCKPAK
jgi:hypothetical protein